MGSHRAYLRCHRYLPYSSTRTSTNSGSEIALDLPHTLGVVSVGDELVHGHVRKGGSWFSVSVACGGDRRKES